MQLNLFRLRAKGRVKIVYNDIIVQNEKMYAIQYTLSETYNKIGQGLQNTSMHLKKKIICN